jgi:DNA-directed RNA polymerase subunit RPC12/RpoP
MDCKLEVFERHDLGRRGRNLEPTYRFAVVDNSLSKQYPSNFVCMLPLNIDQGKGKTVSAFKGLFGDESLPFAIKLLKEALKTESSVKVKTEIQRRLNLIDPNCVNLIKCSGCRKQFQPKTVRRYKQNFCPECVQKKFCKQAPSAIKS